jgi:hypothetical protein
LNFVFAHQLIILVIQQQKQLNQMTTIISAPNGSQTASAAIAEPKAIVLYDVSMLFLSSEPIFVSIIEHTSLACIEVIAYCPSKDVEAPRLYLNSNIINLKLAEFLNESGTKTSCDEHFISFITSRLVVPDYSANQSFTVKLMPITESDQVNKETNRLDFELKSKPENVKQFETYRPTCHM